MKLQEAINHCYDIANGKNNQCEECKKEHFQLAKWLEELQRRREYDKL